MHLIRLRIPSFRDSCLLCVILMTLLFSAEIVKAAPSFGPQSSTKNVEWGFDFVEEFDGLRNWRPDNGAEGNVGEAPGDEYKMPLLENGEPGPWRYYSVWTNETPPQDWIGEYGDNRVWRGGKSLVIDIGGARGPSRIGLYFFPGYQEYYLFFMVNIPKHEWPTSCVGGSCDGGGPEGIYEEGKPYTWFAAWKFLTHNIGCEVENCWVKGEGYSPIWHQIASLKQYNYGTAPGIMFHVSDPARAADKWALYGGISLDSYGPRAVGYVGDWFGVEYHINQTATQTIHDIWVYDKQGNATQVGSNLAWDTPGEAQGKNWDYFFFGGNNANSYTWGPTMQPSAYYIDDVIIDDKRIGPKYFAFIQDEGLTAPSNLKISTPGE